MPTAIGFVGIGNMGWPMAANPVRAGFAVAVCDTAPGRATSFAREVGGRAASTAAETAAGAAVLVTMLPTSAHVAEVIGDVSASLSAGAVVVEMSSGVPSVTQALAADLQGQGVCLVDCPGQAMKALNNLDSGFGLDLMAKDLGIAVGMAREAGVAAPFSAICAELWASAGGLLGPGRDHTEMARFSEAIGGLELRGAPSDQEAERVGRSPQPTRGDLAPDQQLHSRPTGNAATARRADVTHPRTLHGR